ncbi:MAG: outer membrane protein assembly factor BamB [Planctomycetota bacterium]
MRCLSVTRKQPCLFSATLFFALIVPMISSTTLVASDWPAFRGPRGDGYAVNDEAPTKWSDQENIAWKVALPRPANGSPIVSRGHVFVTSAQDEKGHQRSLYAFDRKTGKELWVRTVNIDKDLPTHETNPFCGTTPVSNGERVVVWHASAGLYCYDFAGKELWKRDLGEYQHMWGYGTSPVLDGDRVILHTGPGKKVSLICLSLTDGKTRWQHDEPIEGDGNYNTTMKYMGSWATPLITKVGETVQVICPFPTRVVSFQPADGKTLWICDGIRGPKGDLSYSSPIIVNDLCFVTGGFNGPSMSIRLGGSGNITESHRVWRLEQNPQSIGSGVAHDGHVYRPNAGPGTIECIDPKTGNVLWTERAGGGTYWSSIVSANGLAYAVNQNGGTVVFRPNAKAFESVAMNELKEATNATPAISDGQIFFRTAGHLICVGKK